MDKDTQNKVNEILNWDTSDFSKKNIQKAELLLRNNKFIKELEGISKRLGKNFFKFKSKRGLRLKKLLIKHKYPEVQIVESESLEDDPFFADSYNLNMFERISNEKVNVDQKRLEVFERYREKWEQFCLKWGIITIWRGSIGALKLGFYIQNHVQIIAMPASNRNESYINIRVNRWTTQEDIRDNWGAVRKLKNKLYGSPIEQKDNFIRDLKWYDLSKICGCSEQVIARLWAENYSHDFEIFVIGYMKNQKNQEMFVEADLKNRSNENLLKGIKEGS